MKTLGLSLLVLGLTLAAVPALAQDAGQTAFTLVGKEDQKWYLEGQTQANPTITIAASSPITITVKQEGTIPHNIKVGDNPSSDILQEDGQTLEYSFTSPASGTLQYVCELHAGTMKGTLRVAGAGGDDGGNGGNGDGGNGTPGFALVGGLLALAGAALVLRRR